MTARDDGQGSHQTSPVPCSAPFQPGLWAEPATACPTASAAPAALPWPPQLPPESSCLGNPAAFSVVQEAEGIISVSAERTALFFIISVEIIWHETMLS